MSAPISFPTVFPHLWKVTVGKSPSRSTAAEAADIWSRAAERARDQVPPAAYEMWFSQIRAVAVEEGLLHLAVPSEYIKGRVTGQHLDLITSLVADASEGAYGVRLSVDPETPDAPAPADDPEAPAPEPEATNALSDEYTFETFVRGQSNEFARAASLAVAEAPPGRAYNPLFIWGGVGLGKTHLLYAINNLMRRLTPGLRVKYVTSERFMSDFIAAVREGSGPLFSRRYRDVEVLLVDDVQFLAGKPETQTEFFHTFNTLHAASRQIVIASDRPPQELAGLEQRLRSRFAWGLCTDVQPPDLETRVAILQMKARRDELDVPDDVLHFIAERFDSNIRELEGALLRVAAFASLSHRSIDLDLADRALEDLLPQGSHEIPAEVILQETARYFGLRPDDLISKSRSRPLTTARHVAMYLLRELTGLSLIKIGDLFDRDHSTALHGITKIERMMQNREPIYRQVKEVTKSIKDPSLRNR